MAATETLVVSFEAIHRVWKLATGEGNQTYTSDKRTPLLHLIHLPWSFHGVIVTWLDVIDPHGFLREYWILLVAVLAIWLISSASLLSRNDFCRDLLQAAWRLVSKPKDNSPAPFVLLLLSTIVLHDAGARLYLEEDRYFIAAARGFLGICLAFAGISSPQFKIIRVQTSLSCLESIAGVLLVAISLRFSGDVRGVLDMLTDDAIPVEARVISRVIQATIGIGGLLFIHGFGHLIGVPFLFYFAHAIGISLEWIVKFVFSLLQRARDLMRSFALMIWRAGVALAKLGMSLAQQIHVRCIVPSIQLLSAVLAALANVVLQLCKILAYCAYKVVNSVVRFLMIISTFTEQAARFVVNLVEDVYFGSIRPVICWVYAKVFLPMRMWIANLLVELLSFTVWLLRSIWNVIIVLATAFQSLVSQLWKQACSVGEWLQCKILFLFEVLCEMTFRLIKILSAGTKSLAFFLGKLLSHSYNNVVMIGVHLWRLIEIGIRAFLDCLYTCWRIVVDALCWASQKLIVPAARVVVDAVCWVWQKLIVPTARMVEAAVCWVWQKLIVGTAQIVVDAISWLWQKFIVPTIRMGVDTTKHAVCWVWQKLIVPSARMGVDAVCWVWQKLIVGTAQIAVDAVSWLWQKLIVPTARMGADAVCWVWQKLIVSTARMGVDAVCWLWPQLLILAQMLMRFFSPLGCFTSATLFSYHLVRHCMDNNVTIFIGISYTFAVFGTLSIGMLLTGGPLTRYGYAAGFGAEMQVWGAWLFLNLDLYIFGTIWHWTTSLVTETCNSILEVVRKITACLKWIASQMESCLDGLVKALWHAVQSTWKFAIYPAMQFLISFARSTVVVVWQNPLLCLLSSFGVVGYAYFVHTGALQPPDFLKLAVIFETCQQTAVSVFSSTLSLSVWFGIGAWYNLRTVIGILLSGSFSVLQPWFHAAKGHTVRLVYTSSHRPLEMFADSSFVFVHSMTTLAFSRISAAEARNCRTAREVVELAARRARHSQRLMFMPILLSSIMYGLPSELALWFVQTLSVPLALVYIVISLFVAYGEIRVWRDTSELLLQGNDGQLRAKLDEPMALYAEDDDVCTICLDPLIPKPVTPPPECLVHLQLVHGPPMNFSKRFGIKLGVRSFTQQNLNCSSSIPTRLGQWILQVNVGTMYQICLLDQNDSEFPGFPGFTFRVATPDNGACGCTPSDVVLPLIDGAGVWGFQRQTSSTGSAPEFRLRTASVDAVKDIENTACSICTVDLDYSDALLSIEVQAAEGLKCVDKLRSYLTSLHPYIQIRYGETTLSTPSVNNISDIAAFGKTLPAIHITRDMLESPDSHSFRLAAIDEPRYTGMFREHPVLGEASLALRDILTAPDRGTEEIHVTLQRHDGDQRIDVGTLKLRVAIQWNKKQESEQEKTEPEVTGEEMHANDVTEEASFARVDARLQPVAVKNDPPRGLSCGHVFHGSCIASWMKRRDGQRCPICREAVNGSAAVFQRLF